MLLSCRCRVCIRRGPSWPAGVSYWNPTPSIVFRNLFSLTRRHYTPQYPWAQYAITLEVYADRGNETHASLWLNGMNTPRLSFVARTKGSGGFGQFHANGNTPSGLWAIDLQSPFYDHKSFGKWPVNRLVAGLSSVEMSHPTNAEVAGNTWGPEPAQDTMRRCVAWTASFWSLLTLCSVCLFSGEC